MLLECAITGDFAAIKFVDQRERPVIGLDASKTTNMPSYHTGDIEDWFGGKDESSGRACAMFEPGTHDLSYQPPG